MKNKDIIIRGGHLLKYVDGDLWEFVPAWKDAPIYLTFNEAKTDIIALDCSNMGMPLLVGCEVNGYRIKCIFCNDDKYMFGMKPIIKEKIEDLELGDNIYVVTPNALGASINKYVFISIMDDSQLYSESFAGITVRAANSSSNRHITFSKERVNDDLSSKDGVKTGVTFEDKYERMFTNISHAKKFAYDLCQDVIEKIKENQRNIIKL